MLSWAKKRQLSILSILGTGLLLFLVFSGLILHYRPSNCQNGVKDGDERGVDCGGSCRFLCCGEALDPLVHFSRALLVAPNVWGAVAYLENPNKGAGARSVPYVVKLYDEDNLLVSERHGFAYIPPHKVFAVFEGALMTGSRTPSRATFEFTASPRFEKMAEEPVLSLQSERFDATQNGSHLEAVFSNGAQSSIDGVEATALLFGSDGNVMAASRTTLKRLLARHAATVSFTWPQKLAEPTRIEVLYTIPGRP